ncbi:MAG: putative baseplate assembly protein [Pyrinomonadaceae bacterium]|nr:putative baseplate assembly protein [Pyrinomonadaceae bacterium]
MKLDLAGFKTAILFLILRYRELGAFCLAGNKIISELSHKIVEELNRVLSDTAISQAVQRVTTALAVLESLEDMPEISGDAQAQKWLSKLEAELTEYVEAADETAKPKSPPTRKVNLPSSAFEAFRNLASPLSRPASLQPANSTRLERDVVKSFGEESDLRPQVLTAFNPRLGDTAYQAWANTTVTPTAPVTVYAMRTTASLFGNNAPRRVIQIEQGTGRIIRTGEWPIVESVPVGSKDNITLKHESELFIDIEGSNEKIVPDSWIVIDTSQMEKATDTKNTNFVWTGIPDLSIHKALNVTPKMSRADYGMTGQATHIRLDTRWIQYKPDNELQIFNGTPQEETEFQLIRRTVIYAQSEALALAEEPMDDDVCGDRIELGRLYDGLKSGRWLIVSGERADVVGTSGVKASELVMLLDVEQSYNLQLYEEKVHSTFILANSLAYVYKRDTVSIYGNVVKATHGETRDEVLGSGDASRPLQEFTLKQPPLTYVSAPTPEGIASTLHVYVNEIEWHETDSIAGLQPDDRNFITLTDDDAKTTLVFGTGTEGARLPTGPENVRAVYRNGIGQGGNVKAGQISLLATRPLGVKEVINPLRASGGADKETRDQARRNVPLALKSLDRLISTQDYEDFARTFAGIGKASAARLSDGHRQLVHLTIAGTDDIPIDEHSDLYKNLLLAFSQFGDPFLSVEIDVRELMALVISANVSLLPDYQWEAVEPKVRAALLYKFSFDQRELGQPVFLSEVISTIQQVRGVAYVDVDILHGISESEAFDTESSDTKNNPPPSNQSQQEEEVKQPRQYIPVELAQTVTQINRKRAALTPGRNILPAQLAILLPDVPDTLILNLKEVKR